MQFHAVDSRIQFSLGTTGEEGRRKTHFIDAFHAIRFGANAYFFPTRANGSLRAITFATISVRFSFLLSFSLLSGAMGVRLSLASNVSVISTLT